MKFSYNWLKNWVPHNLDYNKLSDILIMSGLEVESIEKLNNCISNVIIAKVLEVKKLKNSDKLNIATVDTGKEIIKIVCGALNIRPNIKVPCALIGSTLFNGIKINQVHIQGEPSNGMLCCAHEIGLGTNTEGLLILPKDAPIGENIINYLNLNDYIITMKITPNRADCLSLKGISREIATLTNINLTPVKIIKNKIDNNIDFTTKIQEPDVCKKIFTRVIKNIDNNIPTPLWILQKLYKSDIKSVNFLVDITNYVMIELGQPMHIFDLDKIDGFLNVRNAHKNERLLCLNDKEVILNNDDLVIADSKKALSLAGIIGGKYSGVNLDTKNILLEAAFFPPDAVAGKARKYGFNSEAAYRFERGVDFNLQEDAIERATLLIIETNTKCSVGPINKSLGKDISEKKIDINLDTIKKVLGITIPKQKIYKILQDLHFHPQEHAQGFTIVAPSFRFDINLEIDVIEEIARIFGYNNIPNKNPTKEISISNISNEIYPMSRVYDILINKGYHEVINYSFVNYEWEKDFNNNQDPVYLKNPIINHLNVMQSSLIGNLIYTLKNNLNRKHERVKIFEIALVFYKDNNKNIIQEKHIGGLTYGNAFPEQWGQKNYNVDFFHVKNDVELLLNNKNYVFRKSILPAFNPNKSADIILENKKIGFIGEVHPKWMKKYDIQNNILIFELELAHILQHKLIQYKEISKFQPTQRDISFILPQNIEYQQLLNILNEYKDDTIKKINIFDLYQGENIPDGMKSITVRITFQCNNKTIQSNEIDEKIKILLILAQKVGATLR